MIELPALVATAVAFFIVTASPGPATLSNATVALSHGRKAGLSHGLGLSVGLMFWGLVAGSGMGVLLHGSLHALMILKVLGGLYLLWLAVQSARSASRVDADSKPVAHGRRWFVRGLLLNVSNPKAVVAWMAALSVGLDATSGFHTVATATAVCVCVGFATYAFYAVLFSVRGMMQVYRRFRRGVEGVVSVLFAVAGVGLIRSAFVRST